MVGGDSPLPYWMMQQPPSLCFARLLGGVLPGTKGSLPGLGTGPGFLSGTCLRDGGLALACVPWRGGERCLTGVEFSDWASFAYLAYLAHRLHFPSTYDGPHTEGL
jgi:hypothetical protein